MMVGGIFCDLKKAFDSISHGILISKLNFYGVKGKTKSWFQSYLSNRYQRVILIDNANYQKHLVRESFATFPHPSVTDRA
jgi:hypothetical protein